MTNGIDVQRFDSPSNIRRARGRSGATIVLTPPEAGSRHCPAVYGMPVALAGPHGCMP